MQVAGLIGFWLGLVPAGLLALGSPVLGAELASFGFTGPEIYPIDNFIGQLRAADLDGDGLMDLVVANNARSKINLLYNQTGKTNVAQGASPRRLEINELPPDARFRIESLASEKRIAALVVADLNGDRRPDLAYYGEPKELVVQFNQGTNGWSSPRAWPIEDGDLSPNGLACGDLNGDGRTDLVLLGEQCLYLLAQTAGQGLAEPERIPYAGTVKSVQILDINGDRRDDLLLVNWESRNPFRFRLQTPAGQLGPEIHFGLPPLRSYWADDLDGDHRTEVITIALSSGRAQLLAFALKAAEPLAGAFAQGQFQVLPLARTTKAQRGVAWADLNGDGLVDLLVAEPDSGQVSVRLQQPDGTLPVAKTFPTLSGVSQLAVAEGASGGLAEVFVLSPEERQVGLTHFEPPGRLPFPTILPFEGKPLVMALGPLRPGQRPALAVIVDRDGQRWLALRQADGNIVTHSLSPTFKSNPAALAFHDADQDGAMDLVVLIPYEKVKVLVQRSNGQFAEVDVAPPGGTVEQPWHCSADVDGDGKPELLLAQKNFLRAVVLKQETPGSGSTNRTWTFSVKDQINGAASTSRLVGAAPLACGTNAVPALFLLDAERKALTLSERDAGGVWQVVRNVPLPFSEFTELVPLRLGTNRQPAIGFVGLHAVGWMQLAGPVWDMVELDSYETPIKDGRLHDVVSGDLNQDGRKDLVFLETAKAYLDIVIFEPPRRLVPAIRWQVFEERTFRSRRGEATEPREALVEDVTGDGKNDLVVLVHDRILVYPQE